MMNHCSTVILIIAFFSLVSVGCNGGNNGADAGSDKSALRCSTGTGGLCDCTPGGTKSDTCDARSVDQGYGSICCSKGQQYCGCGAFLCAKFSSFCQCGWVGQAGGTPTSSC